MEKQDEIGFLVYKIQNSFRSQMDTQFKKYDLTFTQSQVLRFLEETEGQATQQQLQKKMNVSHPTMVGIIQRLEKNGFVEVTTDENDRRYKVVHLTGKQEQLKADLRNKKNELNNKMISNITDEEVDELIRLLTVMNENIGNNEVDL